MMRLAHFALLFVWLGLVVAETVIEFALDDSDARAKAKLHYWIDLVAEVPVVLGVLATGVSLASSLPVLTPLHWLKIGLALAAISINLYCAVLVNMRHRRRDSASFSRLDRMVRQTWLGVPFGLAALYIGLAYFS